jgi:UDP-N-acetylglucosamine 2-epimerase (non-hydrolysing)
VKLGVRLAHVEAGLRSFDRSMPEEINRIVTDSISDLLFCTEQAAIDNLTREGVPQQKIHMVGNVMIDTLLRNRQRAKASKILQQLGVEPTRYGLLTLHRPSNVDDDAIFSGLLDALEVIQRELPIVFPIHPRTQKILESSSLGRRVGSMKQVRLIDPAGYLDFVKLTAHARIVLTDSGGIQEETTILRVPCLILRTTTERPITLECGCNLLVGTKPDDIFRAYRKVMSGDSSEFRMPPLWDGQAAQRIVGILQGQPS